MNDRSRLLTEQRLPQSGRLDRMSIEEAFDLMSDEDRKVADAVAGAKEDICRAVERVVEAFERGGRLIYVGAGTSGRLGVLDASECPPTFLSPPTMVQGIIAGGDEALRRSVEGAEDSESDGAAAMEERRVGPDDVVFGITTGGTTPYVRGALRRAKQRGARTVFFACVPKEQVPDEADVSIRVLTGPEVLTGSTRLKAGTATKMVLNRVTTLAMTRLGKVYENLMVDVNTQANAKLIDRGVRILQELTRLPRSEALHLLEEARGRVKVALIMRARNLPRDRAERLLENARSRLGDILNEEGEDDTTRAPGKH